jgi:hypothetical protein
MANRGHQVVAAGELPITYLVIEGQFLSVAARHKRLAQTTAMSSPLIGNAGRLPWRMPRETLQCQVPEAM